MQSIEALICLRSALHVHCSLINMDGEWLRNVLLYHWLICHFRDCKLLLVMSFFYSYIALAVGVVRLADNELITL